ncbi:GNAT family N-acetyltransferase [Spiractinospora alimapuensis]|uniref:GNAT family N-acetyltransferase n=1 Tax=Spiractinospora alimapuensis TaxID=2820884 RepID=UPI001F26A351|nr:GNAT family N-acetyltransferase [Spiractinospora alimapuensis]QVQ53676.1 GNAT family N-acetyltransferase [Spiractinospora alimapuensis]
MRIRTYEASDFQPLLDLTIATFDPFYEGSYRPLVGETVFANLHGAWRRDYHDLMRSVHDPQRGRHAAVALLDDTIVGYARWVIRTDRSHGELDMLAVAPSYRGHGAGRALAQHAIDHMRAAGLDVASINTGGDAFHAPARALYEELGFTPLPVVNYTMPLRP